jgi:hypothetical protein
MKVAEVITNEKHVRLVLSKIRWKAAPQPPCGICGLGALGRDIPVPSSRVSTHEANSDFSGRGGRSSAVLEGHAKREAPAFGDSRSSHSSEEVFDSVWPTESDVVLAA